jgi:hypothetical protein
MFLKGRESSVHDPKQTQASVRPVLCSRIMKVIVLRAHAAIMPNYLA